MPKDDGVDKGLLPWSYHHATLFFHASHDGNHRDNDGVELPNNSVAWKEAAFAAGEALRGWTASSDPDQTAWR
ncbi:DUF6894 family protein [Bradyrhizobium sp. I1.14.4]|uniref:DUF6894 family protein n=1 Tax=unclassified Bradyrhizobium TaxID=2631580 RepID=UPI003D2096D4